jgi:hypothetical protein
VNIRQSFFILVAAVFVILQGKSIRGPIRAEEHRCRSQVQMGEAAPRRFLVVIIDVPSLMCFSCLDAFVDLCHSLPPSCQKEKLWGVLVPSGETEGESRLVKRMILEKKLRGFIKANGIKFPILVDRMRIFHELAKRGPGVVLFDPETRSLSMWTFPLSNRQIDEIIRFLRGP